MGKGSNCLYSGQWIHSMWDVSCELGKHDSSINIQIVYMATTQIDYVKIVTKIILPHFIANRTILMF